MQSIRHVQIVTKVKNCIMFRYRFVSIKTFPDVMMYMLLDITDFATNKMNADMLKKIPNEYMNYPGVTRVLSSHRPRTP